MASFAARLLRFRRAWSIVLAVGLASAIVALVWNYHRDPTFQPDPNVPWVIQFGRGSGWQGLDTVKVFADGTVIVHRQGREYAGWGKDRAHDFVETTTLRLPSESLVELLDAVEQNGLLGLEKEYHVPNLADGTQWVFRFKQGDKEKSVYFDNRFPDEIRRFADALDGILDRNGLGKAEWHRVPDADARKHEKELWDSIKR